MVDSIKITALQDIGANIAYTTLVPVVNMAGTPTTQKANLQNLGNFVLNGAGGSYFAPAARAILAQSVTNAAQPNITSVGTLTSLAVTGNITAGNINGGNIVVANFYYGDGGFLTNVMANGSYSNSNVANYLPTFTGNVGAGNVNVTGGVYTFNLSSTGLASLTTLNVSATSNLGGVGNVKITGGSAGQKLTTDGAGNLSWTNDANSSYGNSNVVSLMAAFGNNTITTTGNVTANYFNGVATDVAVEAVNNNYSYHMAFVTGVGDTTLHMDADDNLQYNPADGLLTVTRTDMQYLSVTNSVLTSLVPFDSLPLGLGNATNPWQDLYLSNSTIYLGDATISANGNSIVVDSITVGGNVGTIGNIANINLTGSNSNVLYGNGVFAPAAGGGNVSELVNGNNSLVLDGDGNIVLEGTPAGNAVNRGLVWDFGANSNGVNSTIRQENGGLSVRAWTENAGNYAAPVNIITNQDANTKTWEFDGQGNLTIPGNINAINDGGDLGAYLTLTPDLGLARLTGREAQSSVNYTSTSWANATYTGTQIDFTNAPDLVTFFNNNQFNVGVNQTFSINGDEPVPFTGYSTGASNAVTVYTSITAEPDPTTVTSIDFLYQLESYVAIDYDGSDLNINATGLTINIDNDQTSGPDINLRSGDDITLQAKDKALGSESEGGDINILAGDGADDDGLGNTSSTGGDIQINAGNGGDGNSSSGSQGGFTTISGGLGGAAGVTNTAGPGGYVSIRGGDGGSGTGNTALGAVGGNVSITAGLTTQEGVNGPNVVISSGQAGPNALAGYVVISTPASADGPGGDWTFDGYGNLTLPEGGIVHETAIPFGGLEGNTIALKPSGGTNADQQLLVYPTAGQDFNHLHLTSGNLYNTELFLGDDNFNVKLANTGNIVITTNDNTGNVGTWTFGTNGALTLPIGVSIDYNGNVQYPKIIADSGKLFSVQGQGNSGSAALAWTVDPNAASQYAAVSVSRGGGDDLAKVVLQAQSNSGNVATAKTWQFSETGNLKLPGNTFAVNYANGSQASAPLIDVLNTNGLTTVYYPTFVEDRTDGQIVRADVDLSYRTDTNTLTVGNIGTIGNITANNFVGNGGSLSNVATSTTGNWTLASGVNTVSISIPLNGTYAIWVNGNIPNGIVTYTATAVITNTNVPVLGSQYAWYYALGNALVLTSIPDQFVGTVGSISNVNTYAGNTANVFTFGITNNSGNAAVVNYGYTKL
jgi:hypothetical protein